MPTAPITQPHAESRAVSSPVIRELFIKLPRVVPVSYFAVRSSKRRVSLETHGRDAVPVKRICDADLVEDWPERLAFVASHGRVSKETESKAVHCPWAQRPGMLHHGKCGFVLIRKPAQRKQSWLRRRRRLPEKLTEQLRMGTQRHVHASSTLPVIERPPWISEHIGWPARQTRTRTVVSQEISGNGVQPVRRNCGIWKRLTRPGILAVT